MRDFINNGIPSAPCKGCEKRYIGCHSKCLDYMDFQQKAALISQEVRNRKNSERIFYSKKRDVCTQMMRKKKK